MDFSEGKSAFKIGFLTGSWSKFQREKASWTVENRGLSEENDMGSFTSFAEILEKKIRKEIESEIRSQDAGSEERESNGIGKSSEIQSELWTHLVGQMNTIHFQKDQKQAVYHRNRPAPRPRPNHKLSASQAIAFAFFDAHKVPLAPNFTRGDLKKAFRALALRLHPDQGGKVSDFRKLLSARTELEMLFK